MRCKNFFLVVIFSSFLCLVLACAAKQPIPGPDNGNGMVFDAGGETEQPVPTPVPAPTPVPVPVTDVPEGLVMIQIQAQSNLEKCFSDIGYQDNMINAEVDGMVRMIITPGHHQLNCHDTKKRVAVDNGEAKYPLWVNSTKLTVVDPDVAGGMYYMYVCEDGRVLPTKP